MSDSYLVFGFMLITVICIAIKLMDEKIENEEP